MKKLLLIPVISLLFLFNGCSGGTQIPPQVCTVGGYICDVSQFVCNNVPNVPPEVCTYLNLACMNLEILCNTAPGTDEHTAALESLDALNKSVGTAVRKLNQDTLKDSLNINDQ